MDFDLDEEQRLLKDSVERLLADRYADIEKRKAYAREPFGFSAEGWAAFAELGIPAVPFAEAEGGLGKGLVELGLVAEVIGKRLALEPFLATVVLGGGALRHAASATQRTALVPGIVAGELTLALAHQERQSRFDLADIATTARREGGAWRLDGEKVVVVNGDSADKLIVAARVAGGRRDQAGIGLFLVDGAAPGLARRGYATQDGGRAADIGLSGVMVGSDSVLGEPGQGFSALERVSQEAIAVLAAEAVGCMAALVETSVEFLKTRKQFGVPIGSFQVLQHRAVDMFTHLEQSRSMALYAAMMAADPDAAERRRAVAATKVQIGRSARFVGESAVQLHGGIGMTMEYIAGHWFKRLTVIDLMLGDADHHQRELARMG